MATPASAQHLFRLKQSVLNHITKKRMWLARRSQTIRTPEQVDNTPRKRNNEEETRWLRKQGNNCATHISQKKKHREPSHVTAAGGLFSMQIIISCTVLTVRRIEVFRCVGTSTGGRRWRSRSRRISIRVGGTAATTTATITKHKYLVHWLGIWYIPRERRRLRHRSLVQIKRDISSRLQSLSP